MQMCNCQPQKLIIKNNNAGAALMPSQVVKAIQNYLAAEEYQGGYETADRYADELNNFYFDAARVLNCQPRNIAFTTNATDSYNRALSAIDFKPGDVILLTDNDYLSNYIASISLRKRLDLRLITIRNTPSGEVDLNDLDEKLKRYAPRLVSVSHVPKSSGLVQPAVKIGEITFFSSTTGANLVLFEFTVKQAIFTVLQLAA